MIERLRSPLAGRIEISDDICPGLCLRVTPHGSKSFSVAYKVPGEGGVSSSGRLLVGKQHRITLGAWPILGLKEAREQARGLLEQVTKGVDPRASRKERNVERHENSFGRLLERFIEHEVKPNVRSWRNRAYPVNADTHYM